ncbi:AMPKBI-domain-containing protein [Ascoidea rubescens DSM 1968]|uniref:AMPKBI-domain-containing protein n=1 Tax=Ascoidea rubescens DSM 1968 TaxID=1344418 RepID=A0A1D2VKU1_9ASCO|nr:AMPKBI-domain-containing protein [Ascoidea rubescens DSM 1968]ODV62222.1 AMPKBI-domain-containing protein [Ascoidea rubescens DSM 1968]
MGNNTSSKSTQFISNSNPDNLTSFINISKNNSHLFYKSFKNTFNTYNISNINKVNPINILDQSKHSTTTSTSTTTTTTNTNNNTNNNNNNINNNNININITLSQNSNTTSTTNSNPSIDLIPKILEDNSYNYNSHNNYSNNTSDPSTVVSAYNVTSIPNTNQLIDKNTIISTLNSKMVNSKDHNDNKLIDKAIDGSIEYDENSYFQNKLISDDIIKNLNCPDNIISSSSLLKFNNESKENKYPIVIGLDIKKDIDNHDNIMNDIDVNVDVDVDVNDNEIYIVGSFTNWQKKIKLNKEGEYYYSIELRLPKNVYNFQFVYKERLICSKNYLKVAKAKDYYVNSFEIKELDKEYGEGKENISNLNLNSNSNSNEDKESKESKNEIYSFPAPLMDNFQDMSIKSMLSLKSEDKETSGEMYEENFSRFDKNKEKITVDYSKDIPLIYTDNYNFFSDEDFERFDSDSLLRKSGLPSPPTLPPYLNSVLLNKNHRQRRMSSNSDNHNGTISSYSESENEVLEVPNHVILNHLITTSIKNDILTVACITRYSEKYVTQIMYTPSR